MQELKINEEFENLIRPLTKEEFEALENSIKKDGCRDPITILEDGTIIDGHNRYKICQAHNIKYSTFVQKSLETDTDIKLWMLYNQIGKRNMSTYYKGKLSLEIEKLEQVHAKERQGTRNDLKEGNIRPDLALSYKSGKALELAAKKTGIGYETVRKIKKIHEVCDKELIEKLEKEEISVDAAFQYINKPKQRDGRDIAAREAKRRKILGDEYFKSSDVTEVIRAVRAKKMKDLFTHHVLEEYKLSTNIDYIFICKDKKGDTSKEIHFKTNLSFDEASKLYEHWASLQKKEKQLQNSTKKSGSIHLL